MTSTAFTDIPVFSLASWRDGTADQTQVARDLVAICHEVGFFTLVDHGIDHEFLNRYFTALNQFFALPESTKELIDKSLSPQFRGWERVGAELTDNRIDYREQLDLSTENPLYPADSDPAYLRLDGPNQWLADDLLPGFRQTVNEFFERMGALANELMSLLAVGLDLPAETFHTRFGDRPLSFAKLISYPTTPDGQDGVNAHHDAGFITLLLQHGVGGLQAQNQNDEWIDVPPSSDAIVVNLGEMLQSMTGNYLVATTHRVITSEPRYSSAYFHGPDLRASLEPLDLDPRFAEAVAASPHHSSAGFMPQRDQLLTGASGTVGAPVQIFGQQMWNYYVRSYPELVTKHYPELMA